MRRRLSRKYGNKELNKLMSDDIIFLWVILFKWSSCCCGVVVVVVGGGGGGGSGTEYKPSTRTLARFFFFSAPLRLKSTRQPPLLR